MLAALGRGVARQLNASSVRLLASSSSSGRGTMDMGEAGVQKEIAELVSSHKVVVFMKGDKQDPACGFSKMVVQILDKHGVHDYQDVNVLAEDRFRQGVKDFSKWPTIPQVFIAGEFVGGSDIMLQMHRSGELMDTLRKAGIESTIPEPPAQAASTPSTKKVPQQAG